MNPIDPSIARQKEAMRLAKPEKGTAEHTEQTTGKLDLSHDNINAKLEVSSAWVRVGSESARRGGNRY
jgi:hypothetical protein